MTPRPCPARETGPGKERWEGVGLGNKSRKDRQWRGQRWRHGFHSPHGICWIVLLLPSFLASAICSCYTFGGALLVNNGKVSFLTQHTKSPLPSLFSRFVCVTCSPIPRGWNRSPSFFSFYARPWIFPCVCLTGKKDKSKNGEQRHSLCSVFLSSRLLFLWTLLLFSLFLE